MKPREVSCRLEVAVQTPAYLVLAIAPHASYDLAGEVLDVRLDGRPVEVAELVDVYGTRRHAFHASPGSLAIAYDATLGAAAPVTLTAGEELEYLRPSRYCDSDRLVNVAHRIFNSDATPASAVESIRQWTLNSITYAPGATDQLDGATEVYLSRRGVCRDTAHLVTAFSRALGIPARVTSVYAPGLVPMDFHAVSEVFVEGRWRVIDGTGLAPRGSMVRIATGRDAADTAFLDSITGSVEMVSMSVNATIGALPYDDGVAAVSLA